MSMSMSMYIFYTTTVESHRIAIGVPPAPPQPHQESPFWSGRQYPSKKTKAQNAGMNQHAESPMAASIDWPAANIVVGMVTAVLSSPNRSVGWAQAGTGFVGFAVFAGFAACIAWLASAGVVGGSERGAREDVVMSARQPMIAELACRYLSVDDGRKTWNV